MDEALVVIRHQLTPAGTMKQNATEGSCTERLSSEASEFRICRTTMGSDRVVCRAGCWMVGAEQSVDSELIIENDQSAMEFVHVQ